MSLSNRQRLHIYDETTVLHTCLNRPSRYNALDSATLRDLKDCLDSNYHHGGCLFLQGTQGIFSLGADIQELCTMDQDAAYEYSILAHQCAERIESWPHPTVALIDGYALGAGFELALSCDVVWATTNSFMGLPGLLWALMPCMGGLQRIMARSHFRTAQQAFLTGKMYNADEALALDLIDHVYNDQDDLDKLFTRLCDFSSTAVSNIRLMRLEKQGCMYARLNAQLFAENFANGEAPKRLSQLLD